MPLNFVEIISTFSQYVILLGGLMDAGDHGLILVNALLDIFNETCIANVEIIGTILQDQRYSIEPGIEHFGLAGQNIEVDTLFLLMNGLNLNDLILDFSMRIYSHH
ncbi:hypothetical protein ACJX0J_010165 [Zea mays]